MTNNLKKAKTWFLIAMVVLVIGLASLPSFTSNANATQYTDESSGSAGYFAECSSQCGSSEVTFMRGGWTVPTLSCQPRENASASYSVGTVTTAASGINDGSTLYFGCANGMVRYSATLYAGNVAIDGGAVGPGDVMMSTMRESTTPIRGTQEFQVTVRLVDFTQGWSVTVRGQESYFGITAFWELASGVSKGSGIFDNVVPNFGILHTFYNFASIGNFTMESLSFFVSSPHFITYRETLADICCYYSSGDILAVPSTVTFARFYVMWVASQ